MKTTYEFVVETLDYYEDCGDDPDIIDVSFFPTLKEAENYANTCEEPWRICLCRDTGDEYEGIAERYYAYPDSDGKLQERMESAIGFKDGPETPQRFKRLVIPLDNRPH